MTTATATGTRTGRLRGETAFLVTALLVHAGNYLFNLLLSRQLGPADFAELNLVVTLLLVLTVVTHTVQLIAARMTAELDVTSGADAAASLHRWIRRRAWTIGAAAGLVLALGAPLWQGVFNSPSPVPYVVFGLGMPWFVVLGADRGHLQGRTRFARLAAVNAVEMGVRLIGGVVLVALGMGVAGAVAAVTASFVVAGWFARSPAPSGDLEATDTASIRRSARALVGPSLGLLVGQIVIANSDVLVVKAAASPLEAGRYAALALVGRIVFYATWSLVEVAFPIAARRFHAGDDDGSVLRWSVLATAVLGALAVGLTAAFPDLVIRTLFGGEYAAVEPLLWRYTLATSLFSIAFVIANHHLARGSHRSAWLLLAGGGLQFAAVVAVRADVTAVVNAQVVVMAILTAGVALAGARRRVPVARPALSAA